MQPQYLLPILCALGGAVCLALGSERQSAGVRAAETALATRRFGFLALLGSGPWLVGGALMLAGIGLNVSALAHAPLTVVQPLGAFAVAVTTVLHARSMRIRIDPATWTAVAACVTGSIGFVLVALTLTNPNTTPSPAQEHRTVVLAAIMTGLALVAALVLHRRPNAWLPVLVAGVLYGFVAVGVRLASVHVLAGDRGGFLGVPWTVAGMMSVGALLGVYFVQTAYRHGPPDLVVAGLTVVDPMVGVLVGVTVLGELQAYPPVGAVAAMLVAAIVAVAGIVVLSRNHPDVLARREQDAAPSRPSTSGASQT